MENEDKDLNNIFSIKSEVSNIFEMINNINTKLNLNLIYYIENISNVNEDLPGKTIHIIKTNTKEYHFNSVIETCDFLLENYGK